MKFIGRLLRNLIREDKKTLGRWNIEYCDKKMNAKIDLSNEDHCGPCGQYILGKTTTNTYNSINYDYTTAPEQTPIHKHTACQWIDTR
jgi:hypothetical protein